MDEKLSQLRETFIGENEPFLNDGCLLRYLRAREGKVDDAEKALRGTLAWRKENIKEPVVCERCLSDPDSHSMRIVGRDKLGRPVVYSSFVQAKNRDPKFATQHMGISILCVSVC